MITCPQCNQEVTVGQSFVCPPHEPKQMKAYHERCKPDPQLKVYGMTPARRDMIEQNS